MSEYDKKRLQALGLGMLLSILVMLGVGTVLFEILAIPFTGAIIVSWYLTCAVIGFSVGYLTCDWWMNR